MKKKSLSLQKLPEISKQKKDKLNEKNNLFQQKLKGMQRIQLHHDLMTLKIKPYESNRNFKRDFDVATQQKANKIIRILNKHDKSVGLEPIRQIQYQTYQGHKKSLLKTTSILKTPSKKMDIEGFLKQKNDKLIQQELKMVQIENNRRQYLPSIIESEKKTFPYYSETSKKYQEEPFIKLQEKQQKLKIRFLNGFQKWVNKSSLKQVHQNQPLTLQTYRKVIKNEISEQICLLDLPQNKEIIQKINIDSLFLNRMLNQIYVKRNPRSQIKKLLKDQLYFNYEQSVKQFNKMYVEKREAKRINRFERKNRVSEDIKEYIDNQLICSYNLQFLSLYMLSKTHYISTMVQSYSIIGKLQRFRHFDQLYLINNTKKLVSEDILQEQMKKYFALQKDKIENIIYSLEEHLNVLVRNLYKDIEHIIFLNPRLVGTGYQQDVKTFIASFSEHLCRIIRSVIIHSINSQLIELASFYQNYSDVKKYALNYKEIQTTQFDAEIFTINQTITCEAINEKISHGPGVLPVIFTLKKWKRKRYNNIFKFILQSRRNIRTFNKDNWKNYKCQEQRILFKEPIQLLQKIIINPIGEYLNRLHQSQNVNGCIFNKKIEMSDFVNLQVFKKEMTKLYRKQREEKIKMYAAYFQLWELYYMQKPYIDDFVQLYKSIKAIKLIQQEMGYLKQDLQLIRSIPSIIEDHFIRLDITEIKAKIDSTIVTFMKKLLKTCEETLGKMLQYGYEQTIKAKKLNEVTPYTNLAEYIGFINLLNKRQVQKSIQKIAENVVFIDLNMNFLQKNRYEIKFSMMQRYLQSGTWIKKIRAAATQNKQKISVDPYMFLKGVKDKRTKIFVKYNKILKEIIEMMKINQLKNATKLSVLANNISQEMNEICVAADEILRQQNLLQLDFAPTDPQKIDQNLVYKTDLTFFYKESKFLKKYLQFWAYVAKVRSVIDNIQERKIMHVDGVENVRLLREGQQLITSIKISTLNKRFLHLCEEVMHQIEPFLKCSKLFLFLMSGSESYRAKAIKQLTSQSSQQIMKVDPYNLTVGQLMALPVFNLDWHGVYRIKQQEEMYEFCKSKLNILYSIIKNLDVNIKELKGVGKMREFQLIIVDDNMVKILKKCLQTMKILQDKYGNIFEKRDYEQDLVIQASKKLNIFCKSIIKMKNSCEQIQKFYSLFQLVYPSVSHMFESLNLGSYFVAYENVMVEMSKKADLAKKLTFATFYDDKVRINCDEDLRKLNEFQIRFYSQMVEHFGAKTPLGFSPIQREAIYQILRNLNHQNFNKIAKKQMGDWCKNVKFSFQYENQYFVCLDEMQTIHGQKIKLKKRQKLFDFREAVENDSQKTSIRFGVLVIIQNVNRQIVNKVQQQTFAILKTIYQYHYNLKSIFHFYLYIDNLLFQSVINALNLVFHLDLEMLYENKYDLNLLLQTIQQNKAYTPKQKEGQMYIDALARISDQFIAIINVLQEKQYCLQDVERGRARKMYAYHSIPRLTLEHYKPDENKHWLDQLKQEKQDDFINNTHLNPSLAKLHLMTLDILKVQPKQIEKKQLIQNFQQDLNIANIVKQSKTQRSRNSAEKNKIKIIANVAPSHFEDIVLPFKYQIVNRCILTQYIYDSYRASQLLMEAIKTSKILITNIHPNYQMFGHNFFKVSKFVPYYDKHLAIIATTAKEVLNCLKSAISYQRHKVNKPIYIYYNNLKYEQIKSEQVDQHSIVFQLGSKLHLNNLLKKELNFNERQVFNALVEIQTHFDVCYPFSESGFKLFPANLLKFNIDGKQRDILGGMIYNYQIRGGLEGEVTQQKLMLISNPIYAISDSYFILNQYFDLADYIYTKLIKVDSNDKNKQVLNEVINTMINIYHHTLAAFVLPIYHLTRQELFATMQYQSYDQKIQDRYDKNSVTTKTIHKPYFSQGLLHQLISSLHNNEFLSERWNQFLVKGFEDAQIKWFIIDISEDTPICKQVFQFFMQSYSNAQYVFENGDHFSTQFHFQQKIIKQHKHKLIFIIHPSFLNQYRTDFPPIPIINESAKFNLLKEFKIFITSLDKLFPSYFLQLIDMASLLHTFKQISQCVDLKLVSVSSMQMMKNVFQIMMNQIRKRQIAVGHYSQSMLAVQESKENLYGAIDLRQKNKLSQEQLIELQEIQKRMDATRRQIYKAFTQNQKYDQLLTKQAHDKLERQFFILNPPAYNKQEINQIARSSLIFSFFYSLVLISPPLKQSLSKSFEGLTNQANLYEYCFSVQSNSWQRWQQIDTHLTGQTCSSNTSNKILHAKEILRHNLSKFKLQALKNYVQDMDTLHNYEHPIINMKGYEIYILKLFMLYNIPFQLTLPKDSYPTWVYQYQLRQLQKASIINEPIRFTPESKNKKISRFLGMITLKGITIKEVRFQKRSDLYKWKSLINYGLLRNGDQWYQIKNTCVYFIKKQDGNDKINDPKSSMIKSHIMVEPNLNRNFYRILTVLFNSAKLQALESNIENIIISLKTYENQIEFLQHFKLRQYYLKNLTIQQLLQIYGLKIRVINQEGYNECRRKLKDIISKIKMLQSQNKEEFLPQELEKLRVFDKVQEINDTLSRLVECVDLDRNQMSKNYIVRYLLKKPRKYERLEAVEQVSPKKRLKAPAKPQFDDILYFDKNYDHSNVQLEGISQIIVFFNLNEKILLVQNKGPYHQKIISKYILSYKCYKKAMETMTANKNIKPFSVDLSRLENYQINYKIISIYNKYSLELLKQELSQIEPKDKLVLVAIYNIHVFKELLFILNQHIIEYINKPRNHYFLLFAPQMELNYNHGLRTVCEDEGLQGNYLTYLKEEKQLKLLSKLEAYIKSKAVKQINLSKIGQDYIIAALQKMNQMKKYALTAENDLLTKKEAYQKTLFEIQSAGKSIKQTKESIQSNQKKIKQLEFSLHFWKLKREFYIGSKQFKQIHDKVKQMGKKRLQKQLIRPEYIEDNSFNISYIYTFNILGDNSYFQDKSLPLLDQEYELNKNYLILEDQRKLFLRHFNYGRLNALIQNEELVFGDALITQDHLVMCDKVRSKFVYLHHVHEAIFQEKNYSKECQFSLNQILKEQIHLIHRFKRMDVQQMFNKYIAYLFAHKYINFIIAKSIETITAQLEKMRENIIRMKEKIEHEQLRYSSSQTFLQQIKSKYEINQRQLQSCKKNEQAYTKVVNQNVSIISSFFFTHLVGIPIDYDSNFQNRVLEEQMIASKAKQKKNFFQEDEELKKEEGCIRSIKNLQVLESITEYIIDQMTNIKRRNLNNKQKQFLLNIISTTAFQQLIEKYSIETLDELYQNCIIYLLNQLFPSQVSLYPYQIHNNISEIQSLLDYRKFNIISLAQIYKSHTHYLCNQMQSNYRYQVKGLLGRISNKKEILNNALSKFSQKIALIQVKSSQSIARFSLQGETVSGIQQFFMNSLKSITGTVTENMYYDGEWLSKNEQKWKQYKSIVEIIKEQLSNMYGLDYNNNLLLYYIRLIGIFARKSSLRNLHYIIEQIYYDHNFKKRRSIKQIKQVPLQKRLQAKQQQKQLQISYISTLESFFSLPINLVLVHGPSNLAKILFVKALKSNKILRRKQELEFHIEDNKSKEYWILITISHSQSIQALLTKMKKLKQQLALTEQNNTKFFLFFQSQSWLDGGLQIFEEQIQPIYYFNYSNSPASIYYHGSSIFQQYSQKMINSELTSIFNIAKYYCNSSNHIPIHHHAALSSLTKQHFNEFIQNTFELFDTHPQSIYFKIVYALCNNIDTISQSFIQRLQVSEKEKENAYINLWEDEPLFDEVVNTEGIISKGESLLQKWMIKITNQLGKEGQSKRNTEQKISFSQLMKAKADQAEFELDDIQTALSNPYLFIIVNKCFSKLIEKILTKRNKSNNPMYNFQSKKDTKLQPHQLLEITSKRELLLEVLQGAHTSALKLNNISVLITLKEVSGSIGVFFKTIGATDEWLRNIFHGDLFMVVTDKKHKNVNELNYVKGVFFKYSEPIIYVKKEVQFGEQDTNVMKPLPQYKNLLPVYTSKNQFLGLIQLTTNQQINKSPTLMIKLVN